MGRKPIGKTVLTDAEIKRRWRAKRKQQMIESNARRNEWGTPPTIIDAVRTVFGQIDCDPATHAEAQERIQAISYYTSETDGLDFDNEWRGKVFLNPPYERGLIDKFIMRLIVEVASGRATEAIVLVNAQTDTIWFKYLMTASAAECFPTGRITFLNTDGRPGRPQVGQAIIYLGRTPKRFVQVFRRFGFTAARSTTPEAE